MRSSGGAPFTIRRPTDMIAPDSGREGHGRFAKFTFHEGFLIWNSKPSVGHSARYESPASVQFIQFAESGQLQLSPGANRHAFPEDGLVYIFRLILRHQETVNGVGWYSASNRVVHEGETVVRRVFASRLMTWGGWMERA